MEIGQLEAFLAVVYEGSFTRAAERLNLTQPSLSARIHQLEQDLHGTLFQRNTRPVSLTRMGEVFLDYAERAVGILEAGQEAVRSEQLGIAGRVTVCCPFSLATYLMPEVVQRFSQAYPLAELYIEVGHSDFAVAQLSDGMANLALAAAFPRFLERTHPILHLRDEMVAAANANHRLARASGIPINRLWQYQVLIIHWGHAFTAYVDSLRELAEMPGAAIRVPLAIALPMVQGSEMVTFVPRRLTAVSGLVELDVPEFQFSWNTVLLTRPGRALTALEQAFVDMVATVWHSSEPG
ncbi:MAG: LysR family transcriptional regulator [Chloroflexota bacterium]|nr:LysR family transcriptional regulator [Anaerolineales bacterium]MCA9975530.1 LysR family transcriptional regulator [Anaerolineales bacterium]MCB8966957.1 LysR family transcriptional regulator [Ardenticatenaceae bacterium]